MEKYWFFICALITYLLLLILAIFLRVGKGDSPLTVFNVLHFRFSMLYFLFAGLFFINNSFSLLEVFNILAGFFFYFGFHYAGFQNLYGLAQRSISASILILLNENGGSLSISECLEKYADGKGFSYIKKSRLEDMVNLGFVSLKNNYYEITPRGLKISKGIRLILGIWGLNQLGKKV